MENMDKKVNTATLPDRRFFHRLQLFVKQDRMTISEFSKTFKAFAWGLFRLALLLGISYILIYPVLYMISNGLKPTAQNYDPSVIWIPKSLTMVNFIDAIQILDFGNALKNTLLVNGVSSILQVLSCCIVGYGFARFKFRGRGLLFGLVLLTMIVPPQTISTSLYFSYRHFDLMGLLTIFNDITFKLMGFRININLIDKLAVSYLPAMLGMGLRSGLYIFVFRQFFRGMPRELEDAGAIDGAGLFKVFLKVMLPNASASILTVTLFSIVWQWNDYYTPAMYMPGKPTIATSLSSFQFNLQRLATVGGMYTDPFVTSTRVQAACLLSILPLLIGYIFAQRYFTESIERTGITGM